MRGRCKYKKVRYGTDKNFILWKQLPIATIYPLLKTNYSKNERKKKSRKIGTFFKTLINPWALEIEEFHE